MKENFTRLPKGVTPKLYELELTINFEREIFSGSVNIFVNVNTVTRKFVFHSVDLVLEPKPTLEDFSGKIYTADTVEFNRESQTCCINFENNIQPGNYQLFIEYNAILTDKLCGLYRSKYKSIIDGSEKQIACTQFEATDARKCLPCQDEPAIKAEFLLTLTVPSHMRAISNMPIVEESTLENGTKRVKFDKSPIMSSYLLALVVGEFDYISTFADKTEIRVYSAVGTSYQAEFALSVAKKVLTFLNKYFEIPYVLPKVDLLAIPDFSSGAMENWGCITYRSTRLLSDPKFDTLNGRIDKAGVIAHELVHMWFGNLVTMEQWTHLWLNEGFARYLQFLAVDYLFPEWKMFDIFVDLVYSHAISEDSLESSHAIEIPVNDPEEIKEIFDGISYAKGGSVLRMLSDYLGHEVFRKGVVHYLNKFKFRNAETSDLWDALGEISKRDVKGFMSNWTEKMGYPVVTIEEIAEKEHLSLRLTQKRFFASGVPPKVNVIWSVNVTFQSSEGVQQFQLTKESETVKLPISWKNSWCKVNINRCGFYRVNYPDSWLKRLENPLSDKTLLTIDRLTVISDCFAIANAGDNSITQPLNLLSAYENENESAVVSEICSNFKMLRQLHAGQSYDETLDEFVNAQLSGLFKKIGQDSKENESPDITKVRSVVLGALNRHPEVIIGCRKRFDDYVRDPENNMIQPELRSLVYNMGVKYGGIEAYEAILQCYRKSDLQQEQSRCLQALGRVTDHNLILRTLDWTLGPEVRPANAYIPILSVASTTWGFETGQKCFKDRYQEFYNKFPDGMKNIIGHIVLAFAKSFKTIERADEIRQFFDKNPCPHAKSKISQSIEIISLNVSRLKKQSEELNKWLKEWENNRN